MTELLKTKESRSNFLIKLKDHKHPFIKNPFTVKGFMITKDNYVDIPITEFYKINNTEIRFYKYCWIIEIVSPKDDAYIGAFVSLLTINDASAHDPIAEVCVNSKNFKIPNTQSEYIFNILDCITNADDTLKIKICYSSTPKGRLAFILNLNSLIYMEDAHHLRNYYANLELNRRLKSSPHQWINY